MSESCAYDRILDELRETRIILDAQVRPAAQQIIDAEVDQLLSAAREWQARLLTGFNALDRNITECQRHWSEMEHACDELAAINEQLLGFGRESCLKREEFLPSNGLVGIVLDRLINL